MTDAPDMNRHVIEEFRANGGRVSGPAEAFSLLARMGRVGAPERFVLAAPEEASA